MEQEIEKLKAIIAEKDAELNRLKQKLRYDVSCAGLILLLFLRFANGYNYIIAHLMLPLFYGVRKLLHTNTVTVLVLGTIFNAAFQLSKINVVGYWVGWGTGRPGSIP